VKPSLRNVFLCLLGVGLLAHLGWQLLRSLPSRSSDSRVTVRFAHVQLEPGLRDAFDAVAREYMALHPEIRVEQITVPRRTWAQWMETRLIGDDPPDLLQLVNNDPNRILRHFQPIDSWMSQPNNYNAGTPLAGVPWRDTFIVPLTEPPAYWARFQHYYGAPQTVFTFRLYVNRDLLREITGDDRTPSSFADFTALCRRIQSWAASTGREVYPLAGCQPAPPNDNLMRDLLSSQTQKMVGEKIDYSGSLGGGGGGGAGGELRLMALEGWFRRVWSLRSPEIQSGFKLVRDVGRFYQPGFIGADRDQAMFYFLQNRAVMIYTGSWDYQGIASQARFKVGVFPLPIPGPDDADYGRFTLGPCSEATASLQGAFALSRRSRHPEQAIDFLRYLSSVSGHSTFTRISNWLPIVRGVQPQDAIRPFMPRIEGKPNGFAFNVGVESTRLWSSHADLLFSEGDGVETLTRKLEPLMDRAILLDEAKESRDIPNVIFNFDVRASSQPALTEKQASELYESQTDLELNLVRLRHEKSRFP